MPQGLPDLAPKVMLSVNNTWQTLEAISYWYMSVAMMFGYMTTHEKEFSRFVQVHQFWGRGRELGESNIDQSLWTNN